MHAHEQRHRSVLNRGSDELARRDWGAARAVPQFASLKLSADSGCGLSLCAFQAALQVRLEEKHFIKFFG